MKAYERDERHFWDILLARFVEKLILPHFRKMGAHIRRQDSTEVCIASILRCETFQFRSIARTIEYFRRWCRAEMFVREDEHLSGVGPQEKPIVLPLDNPEENIHSKLESAQPIPGEGEQLENQERSLDWRASLDRLHLWLQFCEMVKIRDEGKQICAWVLHCLRIPPVGEKQPEWNWIEQKLNQHNLGGIVGGNILPPGKSLPEVEKEFRDLAKRANSQKLSSEQLRTFYFRALPGHVRLRLR